MTGLAAGERPAIPWGTEAVSVSFGERRALDQVSVAVPSGQVTAVVGGDGAGKTTLLRCVAGALAVAAGVVRRPSAQRIGYLPPSAGVYDDLSVAENLTFRSAVFGLTDAAAGRRVGEYLERTGLAAARDRLAGQLSGGMRRKLGVVAAMLPEPELLVLDEPTTGVDPVSRADLWWLIARAAAGGAAVLMSTTYLDEAARAAHVLVLDAGRTLASGTPAEIVRSVPGTIAVVPARPDDPGVAAPGLAASRPLAGVAAPRAGRRRSGAGAARPAGRGVRGRPARRTGRRRCLR